jgi:hypothetical protein
MARLKGLPSFALTTVVVFALLRVLHLGVAAVYPETRRGPITVGTLADVRRLAGFAPVIPAYHPAALGAEPTVISVHLSPVALATAVWQQGDAYLSVTTRRGGGARTPPLAAPLGDVAGAFWWFEGARAHAVVPRDGLWIDLETNLGDRELRRFVDTLSSY